MTPTPTTRASLLFRLRDPQDRDAWIEFVTIYEPVAYRLLRRRGLQDADAREVMQELFVAVSRSIERWDGAREGASFRGWLRRIVRNLVVNWLQHRDRRIAPVGGSDEHAKLALVPAAEGAESVDFDREERRELLRLAAERMRGDVHESSWRAFWETAVLGTSAADAARKLEMAVGAVRVAKCRVMARMREAVRSLEKET